MKTILTDANGVQYLADVSALERAKTGTSAHVLKSLRSEPGGDDYIATMEKLGIIPKGKAKVVKSLEGYSELSYASGAPAPHMPVHVVVEESMAPVAEVVSVKDADDMFRAMFKKGLLKVDEMGVHPTSKFYDLLGSFVEQTFNDIMKSVTPEEEKTEDGALLMDILADAQRYLKSAVQGDGAKSVPADGVGPEGRPASASPSDKTPDMALSQEEADNKEGDSRTDSVPEDGVGPEKRASESGTAPALALSQEEADNKNASNSAISDAEAKSKFGNIVVKATETKGQWLFKSYTDFALASKNVRMAGRVPNISEQRTHGARWSYIGTEITETPAVGRWGNRKPNK